MEEWHIEYEIPPLRAIYMAYYPGDRPEEEARKAFAEAHPRGRIRKLHKGPKL